jgi:hypothetical protein
MILILVVAAFVTVRGDLGEKRTAPPATTKSLPTDAVLSVRPLAPAVIARPPSKLSTDFQEMIASKSWGPLFARLRATPDRTPEQQWMYARMLFRCGRVDFDIPTSNIAYKAPTDEELRVKFLASLSADDPDYAKRVAAYDALRRSEAVLCGEIRGEPVINRAQWRALLEPSAAVGNARARIDLIQDEVNEPGREQVRRKNYDSSPQMLTPGQIDGIKQAVASGDPYAIESGILLMSLPYGNFSVRDARGQVVDLEALRQAGSLLACDAGYPCDHSPTMDQACALVGKCGATTLRDYIQYYSASPYESQLIAQYEQALHQAQERNDWSGFRFVSGPATFPGWIR